MLETGHYVGLMAEKRGTFGFHTETNPPIRELRLSVSAVRRDLRNVACSFKMQVVSLSGLRAGPRQK